MLQAHSFLWHYLWVAPNLLLVALALTMWRRGLHRHFPAFVAFALLAAAEQLTVYTADVLPFVSDVRWWRILWGGLLLEAVLKTVLIAEIFSQISGSYPTIAKLGKSLIRGVGVVLVFVAVSAAAYAQRDNYNWLISGAHLLEQAIYLVESGLLLFIFVFVGYFHLAWGRRLFGIAIGLSISACVHLGTWAVMANGALLDKRHLLDFLNMATYHVCVLIWSYYLLFAPDKRPMTSVLRLPEHNLEALNHELERLLQR